MPRSESSVESGDHSSVSLRTSSESLNEEVEEARHHDETKKLKKVTLPPEEREDLVVLGLLFIFEFLMFCALLVGAYFLRFQKDMFRPYYFPITSCTDPKYTYPYISNTTNTNVHISQTGFYCVLFLCPLFLILLGEIVYHFLSEEKSKPIHVKNIKLVTLPQRAFRFSAMFVLGLFLTSIITDSLKIVASRPRPHFLTVCEPDLEVCEENPYNSSHICTGNNSAAILEARMSFPSFYSSSTMYAAVYMAIYVHMVLDLNAIYTVRPLFVGASIILGFMGGYIRYQLNYVHWEDMLIGYVIGATVAIYLAYFMLNNFKEKNPKKIVVYHRVVPDLKMAMLKHECTQRQFHRISDDRPYTNLPDIKLNQTISVTQTLSHRASTSESPQYPTPPRMSMALFPVITEEDRKLAMMDPELPSRRDSEDYYVPFSQRDHETDTKGITEV